MQFRVLVGIIFGWAGPAFCEVPAIFDYRLGDHIIDYPLSELDVVSADLDGFAGQAFIKVNAPHSTEVVLTFIEPENTLQYLEHDWIDRSKTAPTALGFSEFVFGETRIRDIQVALGQEGFHFACRQLQPVSGGLLTFVSFKIPSRKNAVYTFVAEYSQDLADRGLIDLENVDLRQAVLVGTIVSRPEYPEDFWCEERIDYSSSPDITVDAIPQEKRFEDFLPPNAQIAEAEPWEVVTDPLLMITKPGSLTWGDRLYIIPNPADCSSADIMAWAHTYDDEGLKASEGQEIDGSFNMLFVRQTRVPLQNPVELTAALFAPIDQRDWPPFAIGSFVMGTFDFGRIISTEGDPSVFGFSLEFNGKPAGMKDNFWSLEGLFKAGNQAMSLCRKGFQ